MNYVGNIDYKICKQQLDAIYEEKCTKSFLKLEKHREI